MSLPYNDTNWREELGQIADRIPKAVTQELAESSVKAKADGARAVAEGLNQTLRRLRACSDHSELLNLLAEASMTFSKRSAAILLDGDHARTLDVRGFVAPDVHFELSRAAAAMAAVETKDPVVAEATETEISPSLFTAAMRDFETTERVYFFPLVASGSVPALLFAAGAVQSAPLELLTGAAAMRWELLDAETRAHQKAASELVNIAGAKSERAWTALPQQDQALHLKAQRFARVTVAQMRMAKPGVVRHGQERGDLYTQLKPDIDAARETFRKEFVAGNPTMVDYLYLELVRSLANDDDHLLGPNYPGLLV